MIFIAKRHIAAGEEVTDCYGIHHLSLPRDERLAALVRILERLNLTFRSQ